MKLFIKIFSVLTVSFLIILSTFSWNYLKVKEESDRFWERERRNSQERKDMLKKAWPIKIRPKYKYHQQFLIDFTDLPTRIKKDFEAEVSTGTGTKFHFEDRITTKCSYKENDNKYCIERRFYRKNSNYGWLKTQCWRDIEKEDYLPLGLNRDVPFYHSEFDEDMQKAMRAGINYKRTIPDKFDLDCSTEHCKDGTYKCTYRVLYGDVRCSHFFYEPMNPQEINYFLDNLDRKSRKYIEEKQKERV